MKKKSVNPAMAMMAARARRMPAVRPTPMAAPQVAPNLMSAPTGMPPAMPGMKKGGCATKSDAKMIAKKEVKGHESSMHKMKKGGITEKGTGEKYASKAAMMRHEKKETKSEEMKEHKMNKGGKCYASGGKASQLSKANGIAIRGKTKGKIC
jgi:hypothetical protein